MSPPHTYFLGGASRFGTYALSDVRSGQYEPGWYLQSIRVGRHKVAENFAAVATDLIDRGVTTASQLGAIGVRAGGLLMGVMFHAVSRAVRVGGSGRVGPAQELVPRIVVGVQWHHADVGRGVVICGQARTVTLTEHYVSIPGVESRSLVKTNASDGIPSALAWIWPLLLRSLNAAVADG